MSLPLGSDMQNRDTTLKTESLSLWTFPRSTPRSIPCCALHSKIPRVGKVCLGRRKEEVACVFIASHSGFRDHDQLTSVQLKAAIDRSRDRTGKGRLPIWRISSAAAIHSRGDVLARGRRRPLQHAGRRRGVRPLSPLFEAVRPSVIGHRGGRSESRENARGKEGRRKGER